MTAYKLTETEINQALKSLPDWVVKEGKLHKKFEFRSFNEAMGWMVSVAIYTEVIKHHPIWLNIYNSVEVNLLTYDVGHAISNLDVELAKKMDELAEPLLR
ncbi:MAG: 4a-hydroxytetrahydrobiopterin dehydratase [Microcoleus sp.]